MEQEAAERARELMRVGEFEEAKKVVEAGICKFDNRANDAAVWNLRFARSQIFEASGRANEALCYLESFDPPIPADAESNATLRMHRASYSGYLGRYEVSHSLYGEAESIARDAGLLRALGDVHLSQAFIFFRQKDYVSSDALFRAALELSEKVGGWYLRGHGLWGIGKNLMIQDFFQEALPWLHEALQIFEKADAKLDIAMVWSEQAVCYLGLGDDEKAMNLFRKAEQVNREAGAVHNYQVVLANIGNVYLYRCDYFTAISYYQRALALARDIEDPVSIRKWTRNINLAYARIRLAVDQMSPRIA